MARDEMRGNKMLQKRRAMTTEREGTEGEREDKGNNGRVGCRAQPLPSARPSLALTIAGTAGPPAGCGRLKVGNDVSVSSILQPQRASTGGAWERRDVRSEGCPELRSRQAAKGQCWTDSGTATAPVRHWYTPGARLGVHSYCTCTALVLLLYCGGGYCAGDTLVLYWYCTGTRLGLHGQCITSTGTTRHI